MQDEEKYETLVNTIFDGEIEAISFRKRGGLHTFISKEMIEKFLSEFAARYNGNDLKNRMN
jgi:hypothetical protein